MGIMTNRGHTRLGGSRALNDPFMDNGTKQRVTISVDNRYNRGKIPAFSLWAPSDRASNPWKYLPYIPAINIAVANNTSSLDIPNAWVDYFRAGDEIIVFDQSTADSDNLAFRGQSGEDLTACALGTDSCTITSVGAENSGGTGNVLISLGDALNAAATGGALGTGDIIVLAGASTSIATLSYQESDTVVIMEQPFDFTDAITGVEGEGGYLIESMVYSYTGRVDQNYLEYYPTLNTFDSTPAFTACGLFTNHTRFNFESIYRG